VHPGLLSAPAFCPWPALPSLVGRRAWLINNIITQDDSKRKEISLVLPG